MQSDLPALINMVPYEDIFIQLAVKINNARRNTLPPPLFSRKKKKKASRHFRPFLEISLHFHLNRYR